MALKIKTVKNTQFRNNEHFQFHTDFYNLVRAENPATIKILDEFDDYDAHYWNEDDALKVIMKSAMTEKINIVDKDRDTTFRGIVSINKGSLNHFDPDVVDAAKRLKIVLDAFGSVAQLPLNEETSAIYNLHQELTKNHAADVQKVGLTQWLAKLNEQNKEFEKLTEDRNDEGAAKLDLKMKQARIETDLSYDKIVERVNALIVLEGIDVYESFVRKLNNYIDKYNNAITQRKGRAAAKNDENTGLEQQAVE